MQRLAAVALAVLLSFHLSVASGNDEARSSAPSLQDQVESLTLSLNSALNEVRRGLSELKEDNTNTRRLLVDAQASQLHHQMVSRSHESNKCKDEEPEQSGSGSGGGATYIRWGRTTCPHHADLVYKGYTTGGASFDEGAATNHLCLPEDPQYTTSVKPSLQWHAPVYGSDYKTNNLIFKNSDNQDVPCALCRSRTCSSAVMIPARTSCYPGFHREYQGYLMAGHWASKAGTEFICVDDHPEHVHGGVSGRRGDHLYFTVALCGILKCPPYEGYREITCVVCSK